MTFSVTMPALGESVTEGTVTRWLKKEGESVAVDEPLLEVSTDKVDTEIPSPAAGVLQKIVVGPDQTVPVGAELAIIETGANAATAAPVTQSTPAPVAAAPAPTAAPAGPPSANPIAAPAPITGVANLSTAFCFCSSAAIFPAVDTSPRSIAFCFLPL